MYRICVCVWGGETDRQTEDHNILNFDFRNIRLPPHLWEPNYCINMGVSVYCLDQVSATYGTRAKRGTWNDFQQHAE